MKSEDQIREIGLATCRKSEQNVSLRGLAGVIESDGRLVAITTVNVDFCISRQFHPPIGRTLAAISFVYWKEFCHPTNISIPNSLSSSKSGNVTFFTC